MDKVVRVLVVDDSAYVRKVVKQMLSRSPFLEVVGTARDGKEALELVEKLQPDVVTLDLIMPRMDGVTFLREQMVRRPLPVVVVSITSEDGELMLQALEAGAIDMVQKPTALATEKVFEMGDELIAKVKAAAGARPTSLAPKSLPNVIPPPMPQRRNGAVDVVVIGVSTGGPQARQVSDSPVAREPPSSACDGTPHAAWIYCIVCASLNEISQLEVAEAHEGDLLRPGIALLAPAGRHLSFHRAADGAVSAHLDLRPLDTLHRPAVDVLFHSAAEVFGGRVLGVVLSGMGSDGTRGAAWIERKGGLIFTEAEETCVVYGMPRSVAEAGLSDRSVPLTAMGQAIREAL